jgi:hypothetical protein
MGLKFAGLSTFRTGHRSPVFSLGHGYWALIDVYWVGLVVRVILGPTVTPTVMEVGRQRGRAASAVAPLAVGRRADA